MARKNQIIIAMNYFQNWRFFLNFLFFPQFFSFMIKIIKNCFHKKLLISYYSTPSYAPNSIPNSKMQHTRSFLLVTVTYSDLNEIHQKFGGESLMRNGKLLKKKKSKCMHPLIMIKIRMIINHLIVKHYQKSRYNHNKKFCLYSADDMKKNFIPSYQIIAIFSWHRLIWIKMILIITNN